MNYLHNSNDISSDSGEVSLTAILGVLKDHYKVILVSGALGLVMAMAYLMFVPKQYQAVAQIAIAKVSFLPSHPPGINIEEPSHLILRLNRSITEPPFSVLNECGLGAEVVSQEKLLKSVKLEQSKYGSNVIQLSVVAASTGVAKDCVIAITQLIKDSQAEAALVYIEGIKNKLAYYKDRLKKTDALATRSYSTPSQDYFATIQESSSLMLLDKIADLEIKMASNERDVTKLIGSIYVSDAPATTSKPLILLIGLLEGLLLGCLFQMGRQFWLRWKSNSHKG